MPPIASTQQGTACAFATVTASTRMANASTSMSKRAPKAEANPLAPGCPSIGAVEHQRGPGNRGKEPPFRRAQWCRLDRPRGDQAGDCRPDERDPVRRAEPGMRMVRGEPPLDGEEQASE